MQKLLMFIACVSVNLALFAQKGGKKIATVSKAAKPTQTMQFKNLADSASYAIGLSVASFYKQQGIVGLNNNLVTKAMNDVMNNANPALTYEAANNAIISYQTKLSLVKSKPNIEIGEKFLASCKTKSNIKSTPSGLQYEVITQGTGIKPTAADSVTCHYKGTFVDGREFDNSFSRGEPITFSLANVIKGWTEGLQLMNEGSKYKLYVPYTLGYGPSDYQSIPGGSALIFEIELIKVSKGTAPAAQ
jgi:FKBP-type peptidyl-prolyl cis-trans isomerase